MDLSWLPPMLTGMLIGGLAVAVTLMAWACCKVGAYDEAEYGGRTCHAVEKMASASGITYFECDGCGAHLPNDIAGHYCWKCGARVEVGE